MVVGITVLADVVVGDEWRVFEPEWRAWGCSRWQIQMWKENNLYHHHYFSLKTFPTNRTIEDFNALVNCDFL